MSPHACSERSSQAASRDEPAPSRGSLMNGEIRQNGTRCQDGPPVAEHVRHENRSELHVAAEDEVLDMLCVGFGPASLAIAIALHDSLIQEKSSGTMEHRDPKVLFLEKQPRFAWHAGMLIPGAKMQISWLKDLATLRNPKSDFTFINYLHQHDRLIHFTNLGTFLPHRLEYEDYMRWCADWFDDVVQYSQEVVSVAPKTTTLKQQPVRTFQVTYRDTSTGTINTRESRNVIIAAGGQARIPPPLPSSHPRVIHSSRFQSTIKTILPDRDAPYRVAVAGAGQSAAEIINYIHHSYPSSTSRLLIKDSALRPSDDSPFVNEIFNPSHTDIVYGQSAPVRSAALAADRATNYGVVRLELLEHIYETMYTQRLRHADESAWPHRILPHRQILSVSELPSSSVWVPASGAGLHLTIRNNSITSTISDTNEHERATNEETLDVDVLFAATGYSRCAHEHILRPCEHLLPQQITTATTTVDMEKKTTDGVNWPVQRNYKIPFRADALAEDAGIWLQGCCEQTHGLSDTLLSVLATRAGELVASIFPSSPSSSSSSSASPSTSPLPSVPNATSSRGGGAKATVVA